MTITPHDPVHRPNHYRGLSGRMLIETTEAYRLGPALTQAVDYLIRAGRKTADPREDLKKARWYVARALERREDRVFGIPVVNGRLSPRELVEDFGIDIASPRARAIVCLLVPQPRDADLHDALSAIDRELATVETLLAEPASAAVAAGPLGEGRL